MNGKQIVPSGEYITAFLHKAFSGYNCKKWQRGCFGGLRHICFIGMCLIETLIEKLMLGVAHFLVGQNNQ